MAKTFQMFIERLLFDRENAKKVQNFEMEFRKSLRKA